MKGLRQVVIVTAGVAVVTAGLSAQAPQTPVFKSAASVVALNVTVQDQRSNYVANLTAQDFAVFEDGVRQDVRFFESASVPVDLIVLLDTSASMTDKVSLVRTTATGFLKTLRPGDRGAVVTFNDTVSMAQPLTDNLPALERAVNGISAHGATSLNTAVYIALKEFGRPARQGGQVRRQAIAVLSDGQDTASLVSFDDVLALARQRGVNIYTVGLQSKYQLQKTLNETGRRYYSESDYSLTTLARETGALAFFPTVATLKDVYGSIAHELANQYSIGYVPATGRADARFRRIVVQVVSRPELRLRTRPGYTPATSMSSADYDQPRR